MVSQFVEKAFLTETSREERVGCLGGLECILGLIRALRMGSCLSTAESARSPPPSPGPTLSKRWRSSKRRPGSSSFDRRSAEGSLHRIPGRMFLNGSTDLATMFTQQGKKGTNQDAMIVWENFDSRKDTVFCGVFDGHGPYGHMVAKRVRDSLPLKLSAHWEVSLNGGEVLKEISLNSTASVISDDVEEPGRASSVGIGEEAEKRSYFFQTLKESFLKAYRVMDRELRRQGTIDCFCSGSTAVTMVKQGRDIVIGNVGDSRAVLGTRDKDDYLVPIQLTVDLKPNLPEEAERIRKCKGRVFSLRDEPEVARVWLPNYNSPGLAMARAFGDFCLKDFGLISVPEISYRRITDKDEFVVLATDGVWDVLSNKEVVDIVATATERSAVARTVVETAVRCWKQKYPTSKVDDCAVVCLFLDSDTNNTSCAGNIQPKEDDTTHTENVNSVTGNGEEEEDPSSPAGLDRSGTVRTGEAITLPEGGHKDDDSDDLNSEPSKDWSALEGVSRVNTLLTLPRFVPGEDGKFGK